MTNKVGVVFVHGIGLQREGGPLAQFGDPLVHWMRRWLLGHGGGKILSIPILTNDAGPRQAQFQVTLTDGAEDPIDLTLVESWWASEFQPPGLGKTLLWAPKIAYRAMWRMFKMFSVLLVVVALAVNFLFGFLADFLSIVAVPAAVLVAVVLVAPVVLPLAYVIGLVVPFTRPAMSAVAGWITGAAGDAHVLLHSAVQFAAMRDKVIRDVASLDGRVDRIIVVAHSQGTVLALEALASEPKIRCDCFVMVGSAVHLLKRANTDPVTRLREARPDLPWIDIYTRVDPVPAGPVGSLDGPAGVVADGQGLLGSHSSYFRNNGQVNAILAALIIKQATGRDLYAESKEQVQRSLRLREDLLMWSMCKLFLAISTIPAGVQLDDEFEWVRRTRELVATTGASMTWIPSDVRTSFVGDWVGSHAAILLSVAGVLVWMSVICGGAVRWSLRLYERDLADGKTRPARQVLAAVVTFLSFVPLSIATMWGAALYASNGEFERVVTAMFAAMGPLLTIGAVIYIVRRILDDAPDETAFESKRMPPAVAGLVPAFNRIIDEVPAPPPAPNANVDSDSPFDRLGMR